MVSNLYPEMRLSSILAGVLGLAALRLVSAIPAIDNKATFVSLNQPEVKLRYVKNSGVCEMNKGVKTMSGYIDIGKNMSMVCHML